MSITSSNPWVSILQAEKEARSKATTSLLSMSDPSSAHRRWRMAQGLLPSTKVTLNSVEYIIQDFIGRGGCGSTYKCSASVTLCTSEFFAMKVEPESRINFAVEAVASSTARDQARQLRKWQGRVFLPLLHAVGVGCVDDTSFPQDLQNPGVLVMELADSTLEGKTLTGVSLIMVAWALASTLALLNGIGLLHGDMKPSNVLWLKICDAAPEDRLGCPGGWPLLTDFGSADCFRSVRLHFHPLSPDDQVRTHCWTETFAAPEVLACGGRWQSPHSDMFSWAKTVQAISQGQQLPECLKALCEDVTQPLPWVPNISRRGNVDAPKIFSEAST